MQNLIQKIRQSIGLFSALSRRERLILLAGAITIGIFVLVVFIINPLLDTRVALTKAVASKEIQLGNVYQLSEEIRLSSRSEAAAANVQDKNFNLFSFLEQLAVSLEISDRIEYMKPIREAGEASRESVEVKIRGLYQEDLLGLLYGIENVPHALQIKRLNLKRLEREGILDVTFQVVHHG
ncbi:MAG TPA: hypothetical protein ENN34_10475 [Deltaproteobacteria bacterium]|nr:hypothetical protein [Deltaproteobacteria bacterium]